MYGRFVPLLRKHLGDLGNGSLVSGRKEKLTQCRPTDHHGKKETAYPEAFRSRKLAMGGDHMKSLRHAPMRSSPICCVNAAACLGWSSTIADEKNFSKVLLSDVEPHFEALKFA